MTICLDELLTGKPTWAQVVEFWKEGEFFEEKYTVEAIKKFLRTEEDRKIMYEFDFSIEEMLNGRIYPNQDKAVHDMFKRWNEKLGFKAFGS